MNQFSTSQNKIIIIFFLHINPNISSAFYIPTQKKKKKKTEINGFDIATVLALQFA